jgi:O-antigen/teichoic acid export membrane protein
VKLRTMPSMHTVALNRSQYGTDCRTGLPKHEAGEYGSADLSATVPAPSLSRNLLWSLAGDTTYAASQWAMVVVIAKLGSTEMVGQFALGLAITAPVMILSGLSLRAIQATDAKSEYEFGEYLALRLGTTVCGVMVLTGLTLVGDYGAGTTAVILWIGLAKAIEAISEIYYGLLQRHERMDLIAMSLMMKGPISLVALTIGLSITGSMVGGVAGMTVAWAMVMLAYDVRIGAGLLHRSGYRAARPRWRLSRLARLTWIAAPLGCTLMLISLNSNIPRYVVHHYLGEQQLGIFAALAHLMLGTSIMMNAFGQTASPRLARFWAEGSLSAFRSQLLYLVAFGAMLGTAGVVVAVVAGRDLLVLLYRPEYSGQIDLFIGLMAVATISHLASALGYGLTAARVFWLQPVQLLLATGAGTVGCLLLVPSVGLAGAAWGTGISLFLQFAIALIVLTYAFRCRLEEIRTVQVPAG